MSGSETGGVMTSREQFTLDVQRTPVPSQPPAQNVLLGYSADGTPFTPEAVSVAEVQQQQPPPCPIMLT